MAAIKRQWIYVFILATSLVLTACSKKHQKSTCLPLKLNMTSEPLTFDTRKSADFASTALLFYINDGLTRSRPGRVGELALAKKVSISRNKRTYVFHLKDAFWSDGSRITAYDIDRTWRQMLSPSFPCSNAHLLYAIKNAKKAKAGLIDVDKIGLQTLDATTLVVTLERPTPYFLEVLSFCTLYPHKKASTQDQSALPLCSGAYRIKSYKKGSKLILEKNPYYWDKSNVQLEEIHISFIPDEMTAFQMYERKELDLIGNPFSPIPIELAPHFTKNHRLLYQKLAGTVFITFNTQQKPFYHPKIRKAIALAIDRKEIVNNVTQLGEQEAFGLIPPILKKGPHQPIVKQNTHLKKAKMLLHDALEEMGYTEETFPTIEYSFPSIPVYYRVAQVLQQQLQTHLGLKVKLKARDYASHMHSITTSKYEMAQALVFAQYADPMNILERFTVKDHGKNYPRWYSYEFTKLLRDSHFITNQIRRQRSLDQAEKMLVSDTPVTPLFHMSAAFSSHDYVENLQPNPSGGLYLREIRIQKH